MNIIEVWNEMSGRNRAGLLISSFVLLVFIVVAFIWLLKEQHAVLFSGLEQSDAASIVKELDKMKVDYQLQEGGGNILVPEEVVHQTRLKLMSSGAPLSGGVGFEIFDNSDFGMTEFAQKINFQRALQGELTRTIMSLDEVKRARVHLVMAEHGLFKRDSSGPSASVTLFLQPGAALAESRVVGIQRLIASSVPELKAEQVTISDQNGATLSQPVPDDESIEAVSARLQQKKAVEDYLSQKAVNVLSKAFGQDRVTVSIDVDLDFSHIKKTQEDVLPSGDVNSNGVVRRRESKLNNGSAAKAGDGRLTTEIEYQLGRSVAQIVETPGKIARLNIAVVVPEQLSDGDRDSVRELVAVAVGYSKARGDAIAIYTVSAGLGADTESDALAQMPAAQAQPETIVLPQRNTASNKPGQNLFERLFRTPEEKAIAVTVLSAAVLLFMILVYLAFAKKPAAVAGQRLSSYEREQLLTQLNAWLAADVKKDELVEAEPS